MDLSLYLFSWETIRSGEISLSGIISRVSIIWFIHPKTLDITTSIVADCDTQISVAEMYNQLKLTADVKEMENVVKLTR